MHKTITTLTLSGAILLSCLAALAQKDKAQTPRTLPASTQALLNGVKSSESKGVIKSVLMILCRKENGKGTGFALSGGGIITTNSHVVKDCSAGELEGISPTSEEPIKFVRMEQDTNRDLALLCAETPLPFGLELNGDDNPFVETEVETWGYPLRYEGPAPVLSRGYVAGYRTETRQDGVPVKHLIVNGALNPGNSGGPLIDRSNGRVIGIVVEKWGLWSPNVEEAIKGFSHPQMMTGGTFHSINAQGQSVPVSDQEMLAIVLSEFYNASQVMIGEAISVSELNAFIRERKQALACPER